MGDGSVPLDVRVPLERRLKKSTHTCRSICSNTTKYMLPESEVFFNSPSYWLPLKNIDSSKQFIFRELFSVCFHLCINCCLKPLVSPCRQRGVADRACLSME